MGMAHDQRAAGMSGRIGDTAFEQAGRAGKRHSAFLHDG
jgi:hypothetical protein